MRQMREAKKASEARDALFPNGGGVMWGGSGVTYATAPIGAQTYSANALVPRG